MADDNVERKESEDEGPPTPLCLRCLKPVDPRDHYCPHCGNGVGQLTPYLPLESVPWETSIWGQTWRQVWSPELSIPARLLRLMMVIWGAPWLLVDLVFRRRAANSHRPQRS